MRVIVKVMILAAFWGGSFIAIQAIVEEAPPAASAFWRVVVATVLTFGFGKARRVVPPPHYRRHAMVCGLLSMGLPWALLFWAEQHINGALGAIMNATVPIVVLIINPLFSRTAHIVPRQWTGVLISFMGILTIFGPKVLHGPASNGWAIAALAGMVLCYATSVCYTHRYLKSVPAASASGWQGVSAAILLLIIALLTGEPVVSPVFVTVQTVWAGILYLAVCSTFIANVMFVKLIQSRGSVGASLVTFLIPVASLIIEWMWFGKTPNPNAVAGLVLVLGGLYVVQLYKGRHSRKIIIAASAEQTAI